MALLAEQHDTLAFLAELDPFLGTRAALFWGNLLGAVHYGGFIPWDDDIDLLLPRADIPELEAFCAPRGVGVAYHPAHFLKLYRIDGAVCRPDLPWRWPFLDVSPFDVVGSEVVLRAANRSIRLPAARVLPFRPALFEGTPRLIPARPVAVLRALYGDHETLRIKAYDHRNERAVSIDEIVERVNAADRRSRSPDAASLSDFVPMAADVFANGRGRVLSLGNNRADADYLRGRGFEVDEYDPRDGADRGVALPDPGGYGRVYCRQLLHTLSARQWRALLRQLGGVPPGAVLCLEYRDPADAASLTPVENDPRLFCDDGRFRWLVSAEDVLAGLGPGFGVVFHTLGRFDPAPTGNPVLARLILRKL